MNGPVQSLAALFAGVFRLGAMAVVLMMLFFPAFKGMWIGYIPLLVGGLLLGGLVRFHRSMSAGLMALSGARFLWLIVLVPVVVQMALILLFRSVPTFDGFFVYREAKTLAESGGMSPLTYYAPGQIWYYAIFFRLFGASFLVAQLCQLPLVGLIPVLSYGIAKRAMPVAPARVAALLIALYPGLLGYILVTPYYFYMYTVSILLVVWAWLKVLDHPEDRFSAMWGGAAAGWGALTKATLLVAPVQTLFFWLVAGGTLFHRRRWTAWLLFTLVMAAVIAPWALRNKQVFGETVLINTSGPLVFYSANNPESDGLYSPIPDEAPIHTPEEMLAHMDWCNEQAWNFIRERPAAFAHLVWLKLLHTWGTETTFVELINRNGESLGVWDPLLRFVVQVGWAALVFAWAYAAAGALWRRLPPSALEIAVGIFVLSKFLIYSVYEGGARHHMPVVPLLICVVVMMYTRREKS